MRLPHRAIWLFACGYFVLYAPYSALTKAVTSGLFPGVPRGLSGFELLPMTILGTLGAVAIAMISFGGWRHLRGITPPVVLSGLGTALIIATTTLAYTFKGVSIVLALLLMRGGVLVIAPFVDMAFGRRMRWFSQVALLCSIAALPISLSAVSQYAFTIAAAVNLALYLSGYLLRLPCMTKCAKVDDIAHTRRYFVQELFVACGFLLAIPAILAGIGAGPVMIALRRGFTTFRSEHAEAVVPALLIGVLYAGLYVFGTMIYLDRRENTFCIPLNRAASLLAGIVAAYALTAIGGVAPPPSSQIGSAALIVAALLLLSPAHHIVERLWKLELKGTVVASPEPFPRFLLFVCSGNTCRSPMAAAIANAEIALRLGGDAGVLAESAGLAANDGAPMTSESEDALHALDILPATPHAARPLTRELVEKADVVYTMTRAQRDAIAGRFPDAAGKTHCLDGGADIDDPIGKPAETYRAVARKLRELVRMRCDEIGVLPSQPAAPERL